MSIEIGPLHVRRNAFIDASPERVWQEFTSHERLAAWFGQGHRLEAFTPEVGSDVRLSVTIDGERRGFGGRLLVFDPARELTYESNWEGEGAWSEPTLHTIRLSALGSGTHVELLHHGFERLGAEAGRELDGYEAGWDNHHLRALKSIVEGAGSG